MAQGLLGAIMIVPGACAAWRKSAVLRVGGYSSRTLAEDCDLTLSLQRARYRVVQDNEAVAYTEVPQTVAALVRQRFRWLFGNLKVIWKHRGMLGRPRYGVLGLVLMPYTALSILVPLVFLPLTYALAVQLPLDGQGDEVLMVLGLFTAFHFVVTLCAVVMLRERLWHLLVVPFYRLIAEPLRTYLLYATALTVLRGQMVSWNKVRRANSVPLGEPAGELR
jgi:biofilm PGA synthesis N-glycosyltransferase PgaC